MKISVIIPYYNESSTILQTLDGLKQQSLKPSEVLLINSGSNDSSSSIIDDWILKNNFQDNYKNIYSGEMSPSSSINKGLENAKNDIIAYMDCGLLIDKNWLKDNLSVMTEHNSEIVSTCIYTKGENIIDSSFIAQTYGYARSRPCLPGSLIRTSVFKKIGRFLSNVRSGYDVDFINRINSSNIKRTINYDSQPLTYYDINYSSNFFHAFKKIFSYSLAGWITTNDKKPILYLLFFFIFFCSFFYAFESIFIYSYFLTRGYLVPYIKSNQSYLINKPALIVFLPISGLIIDVARISGYLFSLFITNKRN